MDKGYHWWLCTGNKYDIHAQVIYDRDKVWCFDHDVYMVRMTEPVWEPNPYTPEEDDEQDPYAV
jgi:hypothetical protein